MRLPPLKREMRLVRRRKERLGVVFVLLVMRTLNQMPLEIQSPSPMEASASPPPHPSLGDKCLDKRLSYLYIFLPSDDLFYHFLPCFPYLSFSVEPIAVSSVPLPLVGSQQPSEVGWAQRGGGGLAQGHQLTFIALWGYLYDHGKSFGELKSFHNTLSSSG